MNEKDLTFFMSSLVENGITFYDAESKPFDNADNLSIENPSYPPEAHDHVAEIIFIMEGAPAIHVNGGWILINAGQTRVFAPGATHSESCSSPTSPYRMLWVILSPQCLHFRQTEYSVSTRNHSCSTKRLSLSSPASAKLWSASRCPELARDPLSQAQFHIALLESLRHVLKSDLLQGNSASPHHTQIVELIADYINEHYWKDISLEQLAKIAHYSPPHLNVVFKKCMSMPVHQYICETRLQKARQLLETESLLVKQVARAVGFADPLYFSRMFKRRFGACPQEFQAIHLEAGND